MENKGEPYKWLSVSYSNSGPLDTSLCQDFYVSAGDLNSDPHVCMVGILSTEPPCLPLPIPLMQKKKN